MIKRINNFFNITLFCNAFCNIWFCRIMLQNESEIYLRAPEKSLQNC